MSGNKKRINRNKDNLNTNIGNILQELTPKHRDVNRSAFLGFLQSLSGTEVEVFMIEGFTYRATYLTATPFEGKKLQVVLKAARKLNEIDPNNNNSNDFGSTLILPFDQIKYITVVKSNLVSTSQAKELETDVMLSKRTNIAELDGRDLQSIDSSWLTPETSASLETRSSIGTWNQFEANKRLYNYQDTYDENIYTKKLDRSQLTREQVERAEKIAAQIENTSSSNFHLREERGQIATGEEENYDEEDRYSGVLRQPSPGANSKSYSKNSKGSPSGLWRRIQVPNQQSNSSPNNTPTNHNNHSNNSHNNNNNHNNFVKSNSGSGSPAHFSSSSSSSSSSSWGSKSSTSNTTSTVVEHSYKNALQSGESKSDTSLPPGFGKAPSTEGGYFKSNIDASNIATNISFYGTIESDESDKKETDNKPLVQSSSSSSSSTSNTISSDTTTTVASSLENNNNNNKSDSTIAYLKNNNNNNNNNNNENIQDNNNNNQLAKESLEQSATTSDPVKTDSTTTTTASKPVLRATAAAWVPNANAPVFSPSTSSSSTPTSIATSTNTSATLTTSPSTTTTTTATTTTTNINNGVGVTGSNNNYNNNNNNNNSHHNNNNSNHHNSNYHGNNNPNGNLNNGYNNNRGPKQNKRNNPRQNNNYHNNNINNNVNNVNNMYDQSNMYGGGLQMPFAQYDQHHMYAQPMQEMPYMTIPYDQGYPVDYYPQPVYPMMIPPQPMPLMLPYPEQVMMMPNAQFYQPHMMVSSVPVAPELVGIENANVAVAPGLTDSYKIEGHHNDGN